MNKERFLAAIDAYMGLRADGLEQTPDGIRTREHLFTVAPPAFKHILSKRVIEFSFMPEYPNGYAANGEPVHKLETLSLQLGTNEEEVKQALIAMMAAVDEAPIQKSQVFLH